MEIHRDGACISHDGPSNKIRGIESYRRTMMRGVRAAIKIYISPLLLALAVLLAFLRRIDISLELVTFHGQGFIFHLRFCFHWLLLINLKRGPKDDLSEHLTIYPYHMYNTLTSQ